MKKLFKTNLFVIIAVLIFQSTVFAQCTTKIDAFTYNGWSIPAYDGDICEEINNNEPKFTEEQFTQDIYCNYGELDSLGRVTTCEGNLDHTLMPTEERGNISSVYPTGWMQKKYSIVESGWLYNRSHLIMWALTGQNANKNNLMTGTRQFNTKGMLVYETSVLNYLKADEDNNVLYRITPVFQGTNLLATGIIMEAESVDDDGTAIKYAIFVYNVQDDIALDYSNGNSILASELTAAPSTTESTTETTTKPAPPNINTTQQDKTESTTEVVTLKKQNITVAKVKSYKAKSLKKKKISFRLKAKSSGNGRLSYKVIKTPQKSKNYIKVSKAGVVTLKKGIRKGSYKIQITASKTKRYKKATKVITVKIK